MELRQLRTFITLAEELNVNAAADRLQMVQTMLVRLVAELESELGAPLFVHLSRRVVLTPAGEALLPEARATLAAARSAADAVRAHPPPLRLGTCSGLGVRLPWMLDALGAEQVELLRLPAARRMRAVRDGALDAALVRDPRPLDGVRVEPVWTEPLEVAIAAAHPLSQTDDVDLEALCELPLRLRPARRAGALLGTVVSACRLAGGEPQLVATETSDDVLLALVATCPSWTVFHAAHAAMLHGRNRRIVFRRMPSSDMTTYLALGAEPTAAATATLRAARTDVSDRVSGDLVV